MWKEAQTTSMVSWNGALLGTFRWESQVPICSNVKDIGILICTLACFSLRKAHSWDFVSCNKFEGLVYNGNHYCYPTPVSRSSICWCYLLPVLGAACPQLSSVSGGRVLENQPQDGAGTKSFSSLYPQYLPQHQHVESPWVLVRQVFSCINSWKVFSFFFFSNNII